MPPLPLFLVRLVKAGRNSWNGVASVFRSEAAFRQEVVCFLFLFLLSLRLQVSRVEHALLAGSLLLVLIVELLNSAIEACIDRISSEIHPLSRLAKDAGSASVLLALLLVVLIWIFILA
jgi:diacylglycerol kinase (ATP)